MDVLPDGVSKVSEQERGRKEEERKISISIYSQNESLLSRDIEWNIQCINCNK